MNFDDYQNTYVSTYTEFAELVRFMLKNVIAEDKNFHFPSQRNREEKMLRALSSNWKNGDFLRQRILKVKLKT